jgi:class 3 adenylate cyclase
VRVPDLSFLTFDQLLEQYFAREGVERELERRYGAVAAVLVTDFTRMVARTNAYGIGYALALAAAAQRAMAPVLAEHGGVHVKQVADTSFVVFESAPRALLAALDAQRALVAFDAERPRPAAAHDHHGADAPLRGCMGLGFGPTLVIPGRDVFGGEVNRAFVLGEDIAKGGEVLASEAFFRAIGALPEGVGAFRGPADREVEAGFPFHVLGDYR